MDTRSALKIIRDNNDACGDSFLFLLHERDMFSAEKFDELCSSIESLCGVQKDTQTLWMLTRIQSGILKELIYHFNSNDSSQIKDVPSDYTEYLERLDCALHRYYYSKV